MLYMQTQIASLGSFKFKTKTLTLLYMPYVWYSLYADKNSVIGFLLYPRPKHLYVYAL